MDTNKTGEFIINLRKKHNLTQSAFADMFNVSPQAVSKWENGKNIPDILILKDICNKFNVDINEILEGKKRKKNYLFLLLLIPIICLGVFLYLKTLNNQDFEFKTLSSNCSNFNISGSVAYNSVKSHIYISKIEYCGGDDTTKYTKIECILYETEGNMQKEIDSYVSEKETTLEDFLRDVSFRIDNYSSSCKDFTEANLFLQIYATNKEDKITSYKIYLTTGNNCNS